MKAGIFCGALCSNSSTNRFRWGAKHSHEEQADREHASVSGGGQGGICPFSWRCKMALRAPPCACVRACEWIHLTWLALCMLTQYIPRERVWYNICSNFFILNPSKVHFERSGARICSLALCVCVSIKVFNLHTIAIKDKSFNSMLSLSPHNFSLTRRTYT
jgi:hypothetical protein